MAKTLVSFDWAISGLLRDKANFDVLSGFLTELLGRTVEVLELVESRSNADGPIGKKNRLDLKAKIDSGEIVIFEMQVGMEGDFLLRILFGTSKAVTEQLSRGDPYEKIEKVYSVAIIYFDLGQGDDYIYRGKTEFRGLHSGEPLLLSSREKGFMPDMNKNAGELFPDYYIICPKKFDENIRDPLDEWVYTFKHSEVKDEFKAAGIQAAGEKLNVQKMTPEQLYEEEIFIKERRVQSAEVKSEIQSAVRENDAKWEGVVADKDAALADKDAALADKDAALADQAAALAAKEAALADQAALIARLQARVFPQGLVGGQPPPKPKPKPKVKVKVKRGKSNHGCIAGAKNF